MEDNDLDLKTVNIIVAGKTGTGKSTLINAIFGKEVAETGTGRPVTERINEYKHENIPIHIWDTVGLELDSEKTRQAIDEIKKTIASKNESKDQLDQIHTIWYCINSGSNRYEGAELEFIKELYSIGVPFTIVLTQCYGSKKNIKKFEEIIKKTNKENGLTNISIIQVLAQEYEIELPEDKIVKIPVFGLNELVNMTVEKLPDYLECGFIAAQKVSETLKHEKCEELIWSYVDRVKNNCSSKRKIINWDKVPFINILIADMHIKKLFRDISKIYNTEIPEERLNEIMKELGGMNPQIAFGGLISPVTKKFDEKVEKLYKDNTNTAGNLQDKYDEVTKNMRVEKVLIFYGYTFLEAIEEYWKFVRKNEIKDLKEKMDKLVDIIRKKFDERYKRSSSER